MSLILEGAAITPFQRRVYEAVMEIPYGQVSTYKWVGLAIACHSPRAIGQALRRNPLDPLVPCHRVIASGTAIGGFAGKSTGPDITRKLRLLKAEGVLFHDGKLSDPARLFSFGLEAPESTAR